MIHLRQIQLRPPTEEQSTQFPFAVPAIQALDTLSFPQQVTFLVGENGSGKSTFMEALAVAVNSITVGTQNVQRDPSLNDVRPLALRLRLTWNKRTRKGFFLRAEDFFGYVKRMGQTKAELEAELKRVEAEYKDRSETARGFARMPFARELASMNAQYEGRDISTFSHGESFLEFFQSRFVPGGLYLLDEPEAPLSPMRQIAFLAMLKQLVQQEAQFIIATHSPIIMAFPEAQILSFDEGTIRPVAYDELEHVTLTRDFLANPAQFLRYL